MFRRWQLTSNYVVRRLKAVDYYIFTSFFMAVWGLAIVIERPEIDTGIITLLDGWGIDHRLLGLVAIFGACVIFFERSPFGFWLGMQPVTIYVLLSFWYALTRGLLNPPVILVWMFATLFIQYARNLELDDDGPV